MDFFLIQHFVKIIIDSWKYSFEMLLFYTADFYFTFYSSTFVTPLVIAKFYNCFLPHVHELLDIKLFKNNTSTFCFNKIFTENKVKTTRPRRVIDVDVEIEKWKSWTQDIQTSQIWTLLKQCSKTLFVSFFYLVSNTEWWISFVGIECSRKAVNVFFLPVRALYAFLVPCTTHQNTIGFLQNTLSIVV